MFLLSSYLTRTIHDPVGRHIGGILFVTVAATLLFQDFLLQGVILAATTAALAMTLSARSAYTLRTYWHLRSHARDLQAAIAKQRHCRVD